MAEAAQGHWADGAPAPVNYPNPRGLYRFPELKDRLREWRERYPAGRAVAEAPPEGGHTVVELAAGAGCSALSSRRAGFRHLYCSEINEEKQQILKALTHAPVFGDAFKLNYKDLNKQYGRPNLCKTGFPCKNYSCSGDQSGKSGETGWMFIAQCKCLIEMDPDMIIIEMVDNVLTVNDGSDLHTVKERLAPHFSLKAKIIECWRMGDVSFRRRLILTGINKRFGEKGEQAWKFPKETFNQHYAPIAWHVAANDKDVPPEAWNHVQPTMRTWMDPKLGRLHQVAQFGQGGMGHSSFPRTVMSFFGLFTTQTGYNGGAQYPTRDYKPGQRIYKTRNPLPEETIRIASLPADFADLIKTVNTDPMFLFDCVNQGWPLRMANALDEQAKLTLDALLGNSTIQRRITDMEKSMALGADPSNTLIRSILLDTGAQVSVMNVGAEQMMANPRQSRISITSANMRQTACNMEGDVTFRVINTTGRKGYARTSTLTCHAVTMAPLARELLSNSDLYKNQGYDLVLDNRAQSGELRKGNPTDADHSCIPLRYDPETGQFFMDYIPYSMDDEAGETREALLAMNITYGIHDAAIVPRTYTDTQAQKLIKELQNDQKGAVMDIMEYAGKPGTEIIHAQHEDDRMIRGAKQTLTNGRRKMSAMELHKMFGHIGGGAEAANCPICRLCKGAPRRIIRTVDPHKEHRPAHTFAMDLLTFDVRSFQQCKYVIVLKCVATKCIRLLPLYLRSDAQSTIEQWVEEMRKSPFFYGMAYPAVSAIVTDRAGEWSNLNRSFSASMRRIGVEMRYSTKDRHERTNPHAERQVGIVEVVIKSLLMETSLPPMFWQCAASNAEFLLNRLPVVSHEANVPHDYDVIRPIEAMTRGGYSRAMISKDLSWFIPVGTVALVHCEKVRGSSLQSKCRWGVATGMLGSQVEFRCPMKFTRFYSKSFKALKLKDGMPYTQFLGLPPMDTVRKPAHLPTDSTDDVTVYLPRAPSLATEHKAPITQVWSTDTLRVGAPVGEAIGGGNGPLECDRVPEGEITARSDIAVTSTHYTHNGGTVSVVGPSGDLIQAPAVPIGGMPYDCIEGDCHTTGLWDEDEETDTPVDRLNIESIIHKTGSEMVTQEVPHHLNAKSLGLDDVTIHIKAIPAGKLRIAMRNHGKRKYAHAFPLPSGSDQPHPGYHVIRRSHDSLDKLYELFDIDSYQDRIKYRSRLTESGIPKRLLTPGTRPLPIGMAIPKPKGTFVMPVPVIGSVFTIPDTLVAGGGHTRGPMPTIVHSVEAHQSDTKTKAESSHNKKRSRSEQLTLFSDVDVDKLWVRSGQWVRAGITLRTGDNKECRVLSAVVKRRKYKKKVPTGAVGSLHEPPPTTIEKALNHPTKAWDWLKSILDEWKGLEDLGVLKHNHTIKECRNMGITSTPVPLTIVLTHQCPRTRPRLGSTKKKVAETSANLHMWV